MAVSESPCSERCEQGRHFHPGRAVESRDRSEVEKSEGSVGTDDDVAGMQVDVKQAVHKDLIEGGIQQRRRQLRCDALA